MKRLLLALVMTALTVSGTHCIAQQIGTFNRQAIVVAYYRSALWTAEIQTHEGDLAQARKAKDKAKVRELSAWGEQSQELAHEQLIGKAPIDNILMALQPGFAEIQKTTSVTRVEPASAANEAGTLDVTSRLLDWLKTDATTRRLIQTLPPAKTAEGN
jgi:hypothetical protein